MAAPFQHRSGHEGRNQRYGKHGRGSGRGIGGRGPSVGDRRARSAEGACLQHRRHRRGIRLVSERGEVSPLAGARVLITGGGSGIGLAVARRVVVRGGAPILVGRDAAKLAAAQAELGAAASAHALDVTDERAVVDTLERIGRIDHLVTAAAGSVRGSLVDLDVVAARSLFESKYWGQLHCLKHGAPRLAPGGSITLFSGWISRKPMVGTATLASVDAAIEALARVAALELGPIRVNAVTPGMIDTPLWRARLSAQAQRDFFGELARTLPVGKVGTADDVAHAVQFLMENGFTTGAVLDVDGGQR
ncbi:SDR family oxidoreductase [Burkholderia sp. Cy-647]|nr:SDR family oxidoreductase [Burkholderia sp. Tr-860]NIF62942.1 SDR family oxidoreductase [Burkholderia sp. Cy-647]NIF97437.1 SDR family oxidoreductase [Burkholderia sp. Ax-1720]